MLLGEPTINIYIPFILCCENINVNSKINNDTEDIDDDDEQYNNIDDDVKINTVNKSYENLANKLKNVNVLPIDFYNDNNSLKNEYIEESIKIGFNFVTNKLLRFKNINKSKKTLDIKIFEELEKFIIDVIFVYGNEEHKDFFKKFYYSIKHLKRTNYILDKKNIKRFNHVKSIIFSMKEMRDWFYVKEITNRFREGKIEDDVIYCTADSINLFRAILYNISSINTHNNNIKYFALYDSKINSNNIKSRYIIYKQISPSYFYSYYDHNQMLIKKKIFNDIISLDTNFISKIKTGGKSNLDESIYKLITHETNSNNIKEFNKNKINIKTYCIVSNKMNYYKIRLELNLCLMNLIYSIGNIACSSKKIFNQIKKNKLSNDNIDCIAKFIYNIDKLKKITNKYEPNVLKCIDLECNNYNNNNYNYNNNNNNNNIDYVIYNYDNKNKYLSKLEDKYLKFEVDVNEWEFDEILDDYLHTLHNFNRWNINNLNDKINKFKCDQFYSNHNYIPTQSDLFFSIVFSHCCNMGFDVKNREYFGYVMKQILNTHDYQIIRNALHVYYDDENSYSDVIKGFRKLVTTYDEEEGDYVNKFVFDDRYKEEYKNLPVEEFEIDDIESKSDYIQNLIKDIIEEFVKNQFAID